MDTAKTISGTALKLINAFRWKQNVTCTQIVQMAQMRKVALMNTRGRISLQNHQTLNVKVRITTKIRKSRLRF